MYLLEQEIANEMAKMGPIEYPIMKRLFEAETEEEAEEIEEQMRAEVTARTELPQVARAFVIFLPLLLESKLISKYINKTKNYGLRGIAPEILTAKEAALYAERDIRLTDREVQVLIVELRAQQYQNINL